MINLHESYVAEPGLEQTTVRRDVNCTKEPGVFNYWHPEFINILYWSILLMRIFLQLLCVTLLSTCNWNPISDNKHLQLKPDFW